MIRAALEDQTRLWDGIGHFDAVAHLVLRYGVERPGAPLQRGVKRMRAKECFRNATLTALGGSMDYCEGYAIRPMLGIPIHHAWCVDASGAVIDPTWDDAEECFYLGVSVEANRAASICARTGFYGLFTGPRGYALDIMDEIVPGFAVYAEATRQKLRDDLPPFLARRLVGTDDIGAAQ